MEERRKKKPYKELTLQEKVQLIRLAEENAGLSQAAIAERYSIAKSNVCRILQRKDEYLRAYESAGFAGSRKRKLKPNEDNKNDDGNETLRAHMYKQHQISRMFMCRCCNWAFPDKTSLHMHIQAREEGKSVSVPVIGKGMAEPSKGGLTTGMTSGMTIPNGMSNGLTDYSRIGMDRVGLEWNHPKSGLATNEQMTSSAFVPIHPVVNNNNNNNNSMPHIQQPTVLPTGTLPFFAPPPAPLMPNQQDELGRLRERLVLNQLIAQQGFGLHWLNQLPKPIPTTRPLDLRPSMTTEEELEINVVDKDPKMEHDDKNISGSESDDSKPTSLEPKRSDSPSDHGSSSSTDGSSPSHAGSAHSPIDIFKKNPGTPSAFHHLNVDSRPFGSSGSPHVSPTETLSSVSPTSCYDCAMYKTKMAMADNKNRYLESRANSLQTEAVRAQSQLAATEGALRALEGETRALRDITEQMQRRLLDCQEQALRFAQSDRVTNPQAVAMFLNQLIQATIVR